MLTCHTPLANDPKLALNLLGSEASENLKNTKSYITCHLNVIEKNNVYLLLIGGKVTVHNFAIFCESAKSSTTMIEMKMEIYRPVKKRTEPSIFRIK